MGGELLVVVVVLGVVVVVVIVVDFVVVVVTVVVVVSVVVSWAWSWSRSSWSEYSCWLLYTLQSDRDYDDQTSSLVASLDSEGGSGAGAAVGVVPADGSDELSSSEPRDTAGSSSAGRAQSDMRAYNAKASGKKGMAVARGLVVD